MEWFEALILGLIQGLTEYLPVSSSGHLTIGANLFGLTLDKDGNIYLADDSFKVIKLIARGEKGYEDAVISTVAGTSGQSGKVDGKGAEARFNSPGEIRMDPSGKRLIVTEYNAFLIREIVIE